MSTRGSTTDDRTKEELQEELRRRDLKVSGTKQELIDRLDEHEAEAGDGGSDSDEVDEVERSARREPLPAVRVARRGAEQLQLLTGRAVDAVAGLRRTEGGWRLTLDVVEVSRIPRSTDIVGSYEVELDERGDLLRYERVRRYVRSQAGETS